MICGKGRKTEKLDDETWPFEEVPSVGGASVVAVDPWIRRVPLWCVAVKYASTCVVRHVWVMNE